MNYDRYCNQNERNYNRKTLSYYLMRKPPDKILIPYVSGICNKKVLEVGIGYGYYTRYYMDNCNKVKGIDVNPSLGKDLDIEVAYGLANKLKETVKEKFDYIVSFFMTEYLSYEEMKEFIGQGILLLNDGGRFVTTVIQKRGLGRLYILFARMRGIKKYNYSMEEIYSMIEKEKEISINILPLDTVMKIPFASLVEIEKSEEKKLAKEPC